MNAGRPLLMIESGKRPASFVGLLTAAQAALSIGVSVNDLHTMTTAGTGPVGFALTPRVLRYAPADVAAWKRTQTVAVAVV